VGILEATNRSIEAAVKAGALDEDLSAGPIAAIRRVAELIDDPDFPFARGKFDNVSLPSYRGYCADLRLTPASVVDVKKPEGSGGKLANLRSIQGGRNTRSG